MSKTYIVKISADGIDHHQLICEQDDIEILMRVLNKVEKNAKSIVGTPDGKTVTAEDIWPEIRKAFIYSRNFPDTNEHEFKEIFFKDFNASQFNRQTVTEDILKSLTETNYLMMNMKNNPSSDILKRQVHEKFDENLKLFNSLPQSSSKSEGSDAVEFAEWRDENFIRMDKSKKYLSKPVYGKDISVDTTQELYTLFKDEQRLKKK